MKKIYTMVAAALICSNLSAQSNGVAAFENFGLTTESYNNGSAGDGNFEDFLSFTNVYEPTWGSWSGFSISNITDNVSAGWGNQYSAFPGSGDNSSSYAIYYPDGSISMNILDVSGSIDSLMISNSSYAAISMRDGDAFGKQFGSIYAADGSTLDGTNGEDFLKVWVIGTSFGGSFKDSIEVFLADYRFSDNNQDYILDTWLKVDLTGFGFQVQTVTFKMESSDNGAWGMNTPSYFAIDNVYYNYTVGINETTLDISVCPNPVIDNLIVKGESGKLKLTDINGNLILSQDHHSVSILPMSSLASGVYFLELVNANGRAVQKIIK